MAEMNGARIGALLLLAVCGALAACGGGGATVAPDAVQTPSLTPAVVLSASPATFAFGIADPIPSPQSGFVAASPSPVSLGLSIAVADPTVAGVELGESFVAWPARFVVYPIAHGSTTATFSAGGASATITASSGLCGRPDWLSPASQLVFPRPGATGVSPSIGKLYFAVWLTGNVVVPPASFPPTNLHLIAGAHETAEGSALRPDTPPPGSAPVDLAQQGTLQYMSATVNALRSGTSYRTQIYDDACQPALLTGSFTTS
jgi:hypothetical protein